MTDPGLLDRFGEEVEPDSKPSGEGLRLVAGIRVNDVIIREQMREDQCDEEGECYPQNLSRTSHGTIAQQNVSLSGEKGDDRRLADNAKQRKRQQENRLTRVAALPQF